MLIAHITKQETRAYKAPLNDEARLNVMFDHLRGFLDVANRNNQDLLIAVRDGEVHVIYVDR